MHVEVHPLVRFDIFVVDHSLMLCHQLAKPLLLDAVRYLTPQTRNVVVGGIFTLLRNQLVLHLSIVELLGEHVRKGFIVHPLHVLLRPFLLHLHFEKVLVVLLSIVVPHGLLVLLLPAVDHLLLLGTEVASLIKLTQAIYVFACEIIPELA